MILETWFEFDVAHLGFRYKLVTLGSLISSCYYFCMNGSNVIKLWLPPAPECNQCLELSGLCLLPDIFYQVLLKVMYKWYLNSYWQYWADVTISDWLKTYSEGIMFFSKHRLPTPNMKCRHFKNNIHYLLDCNGNCRFLYIFGSAYIYALRYS